MDTELFELCKHVYERTGWGGTDAVYEQTAGMPLGEPYVVYPEIINKYGLFSTQELKIRTPLYTSDYLLQKLPKVIDEETPGVYWNQWREVWAADYGNEQRWIQFSDTPRKALLKLTVAMHEIGEIHD